MWNKVSVFNAGGVSDCKLESDGTKSESFQKVTIYIKMQRLSLLSMPSSGPVFSTWGHSAKSGSEQLRLPCGTEISLPAKLLQRKLFFFNLSLKK